MIQKYAHIMFQNYDSSNCSYDSKVHKNRTAGPTHQKCLPYESINILSLRSFVTSGWHWFFSAFLPCFHFCSGSGDRQRTKKNEGAFHPWYKSFRSDTHQAGVLLFQPKDFCTGYILCFYFKCYGTWGLSEVTQMRIPPTR